MLEAALMPWLISLLLTWILDWRQYESPHSSSDSGRFGMAKKESLKKIHANLLLNQVIIQTKQEVKSCFSQVAADSWY